MAVTNDEIQSRNRQLQNDLTGAQVQRANLTALRTASKPIGYSSAGGYGPAAPTYRTPIDRINYETAATGMVQNDATMQGITKRAGVLTNDANNFTAQQVAARYGVRPQLSPSGGDPKFADVQHGVVSSYDQSKVAASAPEATPPPLGTPAGVNRTINLGASDVYGGGGPVRSDLASSVDKNGVPTYDNSSIQRMLERDVRAPSNGGAAAPVAIAPPGVASYRGQIGQAQGAMIKDPNNDPRKRFLSDLDTAILRASMNPNSRSKRALLSQLEEIKGGALNSRAALENSAEQAATQQQGELQRAQISQDGEDRRSANQINAQLQMEGMRQAGDTARYARAYRQPLTLGDKIGIIGDDGVFKALKGEDGKVLAAPQKVTSDGVDAGDRLKSIDSERKSLMDSLATAADADKPAISQRLQLLQDQGDQLRGTTQVDAKAMQAEAIARGKEAIARGRYTREEVRKRLVDAGYSAEGI